MKTNYDKIENFFFKALLGSIFTLSWVALFMTNQIQVDPSQVELDSTVVSSSVQEIPVQQVVVVGKKQV